MLDKFACLVILSLFQTRKARTNTRINKSMRRHILCNSSFSLTERVCHASPEASRGWLSQRLKFLLWHCFRLAVGNGTRVVLQSCTQLVTDQGLQLLLASFATLPWRLAIANNRTTSPTHPTLLWSLGGAHDHFFQACFAPPLKDATLLAPRSQVIRCRLSLGRKISENCLRQILLSFQACLHTTNSVTWTKDYMLNTFWDLFIHERNCWQEKSLQHELLYTAHWALMFWKQSTVSLERATSRGDTWKQNHSERGKDTFWYSYESWQLCDHQCVRKAFLLFVEMTD